MGERVRLLKTCPNLFKDYGRIISKRGANKLDDFLIGKNVYFQDNIWNFEYLNTEKRNPNKYVYNFNRYPKHLVYVGKVTVLEDLVVRNNAFGTCYRTYWALYCFFCETKKVLPDIRLINLEMVERYFDDYEKRNGSIVGAEGMVTTLTKLISVIEERYNQDLNDIRIYLRSLNRIISELKSNTTKNDFIPFALINEIVSFAIKDMYDTELSLQNRIMACLIVIMEETGVRVEELTLFERNKLNIIETDEVPWGYVDYKTFKIRQYEATYEDTFSYMSSLATQAYLLLEELSEQVFLEYGEKTTVNCFLTIKRGEKKTGYVSQKNKEEFYSLPTVEIQRIIREAKKFLFRSQISCRNLHPDRFRELLKVFFLRHSEDFHLEKLTEDELSKVKWFKIDHKTTYEKLVPKKLKEKWSLEELSKRRIAYFNPHMFRVTLCTKMFLRGIHPDWIRKHMNHLSDDMTAMYNKSHKLRDKLRDGIEILSSILNEKDLIETNPENIPDDFLAGEMMNEFVRKSLEEFNEWMQNSKLRIYNNLEVILDILTDTNVIISENEFGLCINSIIIGICERKKYFSSNNDDYAIGVQLPTYRYLADDYKRFTEKRKIIRHNEDVIKEYPQMKNEYERERNAICIYVQKYIIGPIRLLKEDVNVVGHSSILEKHPELDEILNRVNEIEEDPLEWIA